MTPFHVRAEHRPDMVLLVAEGELDLVGGPMLLEALPEEGTTPLVVDLHGVGFIDSSGLRSLLVARRSFAEAGRPFALARRSDAVMRVLEMVDLDQEFEQVDLVPPG